MHLVTTIIKLIILILKNRLCCHTYSRSDWRCYGIFPVIRALELHKIKHLLIVTSTINLEVFNALKLEQTKLTLVTMTMQDHATLKEIKDLAKNITLQYGTPDLCIEAMRKRT